VADVAVESAGMDERDEPWARRAPAPLAHAKDEVERLTEESIDPDEPFLEQCRSWSRSSAWS
jgi:hypothetical protein